ncbi:hypothetical protein [Legionella drancourtii]|uniref:Uncharacterized protein n=1 Tax=Legionella drancourtii LLAP12 TaxID=658187 RepID=G9EQ98_9GAMM|nr:hypothetical protein [Legionella drancourtii]EHL30493.1 hypothetical protein LDG_7445 [Legionella drancourtii LLAP12]
MSNTIYKKNEPISMNVIDEVQDKKDYLLSQENFERLMNVQRTIEQATEMRPTFKKLINNLVNDESLDALTKQLIKQMS